MTSPRPSQASYPDVAPISKLRYRSADANISHAAASRKPRLPPSRVRCPEILALPTLLVDPRNSRLLHTFIRAILSVPIASTPAGTRPSHSLRPRDRHIPQSHDARQYRLPCRPARMLTCPRARRVTGSPSPRRPQVSLSRRPRSATSRRGGSSLGSAVL